VNLSAVRDAMIVSGSNLDEGDREAADTGTKRHQPEMEGAYRSRIYRGPVIRRIGRDWFLFRHLLHLPLDEIARSGHSGRLGGSILRTVERAQSGSERGLFVHVKCKCFSGSALQLPDMDRIFRLRLTTGSVQPVQGMTAEGDR
jgi:hypothetical protein